MTGSHYTLHKRSVSRSYNTPILDRYHFATFMPRNNRKNSANHRLVTLIPPSEMPSHSGHNESRDPTRTPASSRSRLLAANEQVGGQCHRDRQIPADLPRLVQRHYPHDVTVRRQTHARAWAQSQLTEGRQ